MKHKHGIFCAHKNSYFGTLANQTSKATGHTWAFFLAITVVFVWGISGPLFNWSDTWQLVINTGTTIVTFLMVFLIQHTQNRDTEALQLKVDELIRATKGARDTLLDIEELEEEDLDQIKKGFTEMAKHARAQDGTKREEL